jgi:ubiquinone/menaquinone biosynthesis C-methylase UbiE
MAQMQIGLNAKLQPTDKGKTVGAIDQQATRLTRARYNRIAPFYDWVEKLSDRRFKPWRDKLWAAVPAGRVLEVGVGTGKNFVHYPHDATVTGIDLSDQMLVRAKARAQQLGKAIALREMDVQALTFPDNSFDAAVATCVFCSVPDPVRGLQELARVVKPDGRIFLLDHVRINKPILGKVMDMLNPLVVRLMGANINRRTLENVQRAGLRIERVETVGPMGMIKYTVARPQK